MPTPAELESRVASLEADVNLLKKKLEKFAAMARIQRGIDQINRGEGVPARQAIEALRQKHVPLQ